MSDDPKEKPQQDTGHEKSSAANERQRLDEWSGNFSKNRSNGDTSQKFEAPDSWGEPPPRDDKKK